jgi:hypothetical protein
VIARHRRPPDHPIGTLTGSFRMKWPEAEGE